MTLREFRMVTVHMHPNTEMRMFGKSVIRVETGRQSVELHDTPEGGWWGPTNGEANAKDD